MASLSSSGGRFADGWDDDDDLDLDMSKEEINDDAWSFQDDDILDQSDVKNSSKQERMDEPEGKKDQWSFEDDGILDHASSQEKQSGDEWSFQDDDILNETDPTASPAQKKKAPIDTHPRQDQILHSLVSYLESLPKLVDSLNAVLGAEYNTLVHAMELLDYYSSRPQLQEYTLETELPRMDYEVVLEDRILRDKQDVYQYLSSSQPDSILTRCANQSLLPDVLSVLTGPDLFVRPQFMASASAQTCRFVLQPPDHVVCCAGLHLTLPDGSGNPLPVALLNVSVRFDTQTPSMEYRLDGVELLVPLMDAHFQLLDTARFLASMDLLHNQEEEKKTQNLDVFRDAFMTRLTHTKRVVQATNTGLSFAMKQIDSVANVSSKIDYISNGLLPTSDQIMELTELSTNVHQEQQQQETAILESTTSVRGRPPPPPPPPRSGDGGPAPIIGGLLMSGLSRLAKSVTLPEEDPSIYNQSNEALYRKDEAGKETKIPKLYRKQQEEPPRSNEIKIPKQDRKQQEAQQQQSQTRRPPPPPRQSRIPRLYRKYDDKPQLEKNTAPSQPHALHQNSPPRLYRNSPPKANQKDGDSVVAAPSQQEVPSSDRTIMSSQEQKSPKRRPPPPPPPPRKQKKEQVVQDGWDEDEEELLTELDIEIEAVTATKPKLPTPAASHDPLELEVSTIEYNEEDDIIETRTRWVNPRRAGSRIPV